MSNKKNGMTATEKSHFYNRMNAMIVGMENNIDQYDESEIEEIQDKITELRNLVEEKTVGRAINVMESGYSDHNILMENIGKFGNIVLNRWEETHDANEVNCVLIGIDREVYDEECEDFIILISLLFKAGNGQWENILVRREDIQHFYIFPDKSNARISIT